MELPPIFATDSASISDIRNIIHQKVRKVNKSLKKLIYYILVLTFNLI